MAKRGGGNSNAHPTYNTNWPKPPYAFGTTQEREARTKNNQVQNPPTHFVQIGPGEKGGDLNSPGMPNKRGDLKFGHL